jgi:protein arginine N-methyltransferase 1
MLREFGRYVDDHNRTDAFARAIAEIVRPDDVVVDVGTGFGLLALLAARQGAARVYAIEQGPYLELARAIAQDNGLANRIVWVPGNSASVVIPEQADVVISETLGQLALEEYTVEYLFDARQRLAKPDSRMLPQELRLSLQPVEVTSLRSHWQTTYGPAWTDVAGFDLRRLRQAVLANEALPYVVHDITERDRLLGPGVEVARFRLGVDTSSRFLRKVSCPVETAGMVDGLLATFDVELSPSVTLSTHPSAPRTHWRQVVFPIVPARLVSPGDVVDFELGFHGNAGWSSVLAQPTSTGADPGTRGAEGSGSGA